MPQFLTLGAKYKTLILLFFVIRVQYEKFGHILKPLVPDFRPDLFARLRDIAEKQFSAKLKPIVGSSKPPVRSRMKLDGPSMHPSIHTGARHQARRYIPLALGYY